MTAAPSVDSGKREPTCQRCGATVKLTAEGWACVSCATRHLVTRTGERLTVTAIGADGEE